MAKREGAGPAHHGTKRPGYNPMNEGYRPNGTKGYAPSGATGTKVPTPPKGGTAAARPQGSKR